MGCCSSKEKQPPKQAAPASTAEKVKVETAPKEEVKVEVQPTQQLSAEEQRLERVKALKSALFRYEKCTVNGVITSFFPPKGMCFRIVRDDTWYVYNDTLNYEMHVNFLFAPGSAITPSSRAKVATSANGWTVVSAVVYPLETVELVSGEMGVHKTDVSAHPLSEEYYRKVEVLTRAAADQILKVKELARGSTDEEVTLRRCIESNTPFVDLCFEPCAAMLSRPRIDGRKIPPTALRRPGEYLEDSKAAVDDICGPVMPQCIDGGILGDKWLMCAASILSEDEARVKEMFAEGKPEEKRLGAYRVSINKNGWWNTVLLDDFLPSVNGVPCYARVLDNPAELWVSLLQKAYAKVHNSYASITGGDSALALRDFTGAPSHRFDAAWVSATRDGKGADEMLDRLERYTEAGNIVMLSTPEGKHVERCAAAGLRDGCTYHLEAVRRFPDAGVTLLKLRNPSSPNTPWSGAWRAGGSEWDAHDDVRHACGPDPCDGTFWMAWTDAATYFDGCGVVFLSQQPMYDYRVRGDFEGVHPSVVLVVRAVERVEVVLTLTQKDKRGVPITEPDAKLSPMLLCVSRGDGNKQRIDCCSGSDPETTSDEYNFVVAREVGLRYIFEPSDAPYFVVPRIHRKGTTDVRQKEFVLGVRAATPLDGKLDVQFTKLDRNSRVFANRVSFVVEDTTEVIRPFQTKAPGEAVVTDAGSKLSQAQLPTPAAQDEEEEEEEASGPVKADDAVEEPQDNGDAADEWHELSVQKQEAKMNGNGVTDCIENGAADEENENKEM